MTDTTILARLGERQWATLGIAAAVCTLAALLLGLSPWLLAPAIGMAGLAIAWAVRRARARLLVDRATGLPNRQAMDRAAEVRRPAMAVVARIDRFAPISNSLGAKATARLVVRVAERLCLANFERLIYRIDDGCLAWMETAEDQIPMEDRLEAVVAVMRSPVDCGHPVDVTLTLGIADDPGADFEQLVANAKLAAIEAARKGLRWERFSVEERQEEDWQLSLLAELDAAMASGQIWNAYQPKLDIATNRIVGAEALVRWLHPQRGPIAPANFIPLIEEHGRARDLTFHVLVKALEDAALWERSGRPIGVAVNVPAALLAEEQFINQVRQTLHHSPVPPERLTIEVSETAILHNAERAFRALAIWRTLGVNLSIDDYGAGRSPGLEKLAANELKIDRSLVQTMNAGKRKASMIRSTIAAAHALGMEVVAEGVENAACLEMLKEFGCDAGQGFYIGRPMSAGNLNVFLGGNTREAA